MPLTTRIIAGRPLEAHVLQTDVRGAMLLAVDGAAGSADAVRFAVALSQQTGVPLQVLTVLEPLPLGLEEDAALVPAVNLLQAREDSLHFRVRDQLRAVVGEDAPVGINMQYGRVAPIVARAAEAWGTRLVVVGLGRHEPPKRVYGSETALRIAAAAAVPTLAVAPACVTPPRTVVVATDFSDASGRAAAAATQIVPDGGEICLVHVNPFPHSESGEGEGWESIYLAGVRSLFDKLCDTLRAANDRITIRTVLAEGRPAERILEIARQLGAELVATGRHGAPASHGERVGGTIAMILRGATCSVLVAP